MSSITCISISIQLFTIKLNNYRYIIENMMIIIICLYSIKFFLQIINCYIYITCIYFPNIGSSERNLNIDTIFYLFLHHIDFISFRARTRGRNMSVVFLQDFNFAKWQLDSNLNFRKQLNNKKYRIYVKPVADFHFFEKTDRYLIHHLTFILNPSEN